MKRHPKGADQNGGNGIELDGESNSLRLHTTTIAGLQREDPEKKHSA